MSVIGSRPYVAGCLPSSPSAVLRERGGLFSSRPRSTLRLSCISTFSKHHWVWSTRSASWASHRRLRRSSPSSGPALLKSTPIASLMQTRASSPVPLTPDLIRVAPSSGAALKAAGPRLRGRGDHETGGCPTSLDPCHNRAMTHFNSFAIHRLDPSLSPNSCFAS